MSRNVFIALGLVALYLTASVSVAAADLASPARLARPHKRVLTPGHHHTAAHVAAPARRARKSAHASVSPRSRTRSRIVPRGRHARAVRSVAANDQEAPVEERVALSSHHRIAPVAPLFGSAESLARQNSMADSEGLERILDEDDLADRIAQKLLVPVPASSGLVINGNLPENHKYCRPWTADFLTDLAKAHTAKFGHPLEVSSAVRTVEYQKQLLLTNGNAAAAEGDVVSPHLTGATIDIAKHGMTRTELSWIRSWLLPLQAAGSIDVEEEFRQACFHISVYKNYTSPPEPEQKPHRKRTAPRAQVASRDL